MDYNQANGGGDARFTGLDEATVEDRFPKLPPNVTGSARIHGVSIITGGRYGNTFVIEQTIEESDNPECRVGATYSRTVTDYLGVHKKLKLGQIKNFVASVLGFDPESAQKWGEAAAYCADHGAADGRLVRFQTGPVSQAKGSAKPYTPVTYFPHEAQPALGAKAA